MSRKHRDNIFSKLKREGDPYFKKYFFQFNILDRPTFLALQYKLSHPIVIHIIAYFLAALSPSPFELAPGWGFVDDCRLSSGFSFNTLGFMEVS